MPDPTKLVLPSVDKQYTVSGLKGHWHKSLDLPCGYQHFSWYSRVDDNPNGVVLDDVDSLKRCLSKERDQSLQLYTHHEVFLDEEIIKHTRSSPNWEGGLVTYATCKHLLRTYDRPWQGSWLVGLCPAHLERNCVMFVGRIEKVFKSNYDLSLYVKSHHPLAFKVKKADTNPRGDLYTPNLSLDKFQRYDHSFFSEPPNHTRSLEFYKKSPGSISERPDGKVPKWWRDIEYCIHGKRPPSFILSPCWLFTKPLLWTTQKPGRAVLNLTVAEVLEGLVL